MGWWRLGWLLGLVVIFSCAERAPRRTGMGQLTWVEAEALGLQHIEGILKEVDPEAGIIVVEQEGQELHLEALPDTGVFIRGAVAPFASLEEGEPVRASFSEEGSRKVARWIEIPREETPAHLREPVDPLDEEPPPPPPPPP